MKKSHYIVIIGIFLFFIAIAILFHNSKNETSQALGGDNIDNETIAISDNTTPTSTPEITIKPIVDPKLNIELLTNDDSDSNSGKATGYEVVNPSGGNSQLLLAEENKPTNEIDISHNNQSNSGASSNSTSTNVIFVDLAGIVNPDLDNDRLSNDDEVNLYHTDPNNEDSDGDGLSDYEEIKMGLNPLLADSDGNGILDSDELIKQTREVCFNSDKGRGIEKVSVSLAVSGSIDSKVNISNMYDFDRLSSGVVGLVGVPVEIYSSDLFDEATITFTYDEASLGAVAEENLAILWYDKDNNRYHIYDDESYVDIANNTVSMTTTHFSTYMLVDRAGWYEAWRENVDYEMSTEDDLERHNFDYIILADASSGVSGYPTYKLRDNILEQLIDSLEDGDSAVIQGFGYYSTSMAYIHEEHRLGILTNQETTWFTSDKDILRRNMKALSKGGTSYTNRGVHEGVSIIESRSKDGDFSDRKTVVIFISGVVSGSKTSIFSDDDNIAMEKYLAKYKAYKVPVYTINVTGQAYSKEVLEHIAESTGGQYYDATAVENDIHCVISDVVNVPAFDFDTTDTDGDGLYDVYETAGMRLPNGQIIYTDPYNADTDGDGLTDYEETGIIFNIDERYVDNCMTKDTRYFVMKSDPTMIDSDGDGINDKDDKYPFMVNDIYIGLALNHGNQYINIVDSSSNMTYPGGHQNWWENIDTRIYEKGCGVIAMTDLEIYLSQIYGCALPYPNEYFADNNVLGYDSTSAAISKNDYMKYVEYNSERYNLDGIIEDSFGVTPSAMKRGLFAILASVNKSPYLAQWAPYSMMSKSDEKICVAEKIEDMMQRNVPVVFSYYKINGGVTVYKSYNGAKTRDENDKARSYLINDHYMTVIGLYKYVDSEGKGFNYVMKVSNYAEIMYINYDDYARGLNFFSNFLSIEID